MIFIVKSPHVPAHGLMLAAGYQPHPSPEKGGDSYIKRLKTDWYPRFHIYCNALEGGGYEVDLHLDWRAPLHKKYAHSSEQDTDVVREEGARIHTIAAEMARRYQ